LNCVGENSSPAVITATVRQTALPSSVELEP